LWDIKAKTLGIPLYQLIGGKSRDRLLVYCHASGLGMDQALEDVGRHIELGYRAIRVQSAVPGIEGAYGVGKAAASYEPAQPGLPEETVWSTERYLNYAPRLFRKVRDIYGDDKHILHDAHHRLTPIEAARLGRELEPYHLFWLEDPVSAELQEGFRLVRKHTVVPLAVGEVFNSVYDCLTLITEQLIDYVRMSVAHGGGITPILKLAHLAEPYHVKVGFHGATDLSPVTMAAALHVGAAISNFGIQEHMPHQPLVDEVFPHSYYYQDGDMYPGEQPGLGVDYDEELASKHPYQRAYLPVARKEDGTMFNW
jgi:mannonate dehydratase